MLVLSRLKNETVIIGEDIEVTVIDVRGDKVRLGINAPRNVRVDRKEVHDAIRAQNKDAARLQPGDLTRAAKTPPTTPQRADPSAPETSSLFTLHRDPASGVESYVLTHRVAGVQQTFESASPCASADGRYLWFFCANPPAGSPTHGRTLGVIDFTAGEVHEFPETQFGLSSPVVDRKTGHVFWSTGNGVYRRSPSAGEKAQLVSHFPAAIAKGPVFAVASRLSLSADGQHVTFDIAADGGGTVVGTVPVAGGEPEVWMKSAKRFIAPQLSPMDGDLMLVAEEAGGEGLEYHLVRRGQKPEALLGKDAAPGASACFSADGKYVLVAGPSGLRRVDVESRREELLSSTPCVNVASTADSYGLAFDGGMVGQDGPSRLTFCNRKTRRDVAVMSKMTAPGDLAYPVAPSPQFTPEGRYLMHTTTALGRVDIALTPVRALLNATM